ALRERREDIPMLCARFQAALTGQPEAALPDHTVAALMAHDWPGNVRELRNVLERAVALGAEPGGLMSPATRAGGPGATDGAPATDFVAGLSFREQKERWSDAFERRYLTWLLTRADGNVSRAAREAGMDRKYLHKLLRKHDLAIGDD